jgi:hypothetical protein
MHTHISSHCGTKRKENMAKKVGHSFIYCLVLLFAVIGGARRLG